MVKVTMLENVIFPFTRKKVITKNFVSPELFTLGPPNFVWWWTQTISRSCVKTMVIGQGRHDGKRDFVTQGLNYKLSHTIWYRYVCVTKGRWAHANVKLPYSKHKDGIKAKFYWIWHAIKVKRWPLTLPSAKSEADECPCLCRFKRFSLNFGKASFFFSNIHE